jgi:hypothetical protein
VSPSPFFFWPFDLNLADEIRSLTINPFDFDLYETSQYCSMSRIFSVPFILSL